MKAKSLTGAFLVAVLFFVFGYFFKKDSPRDKSDKNNNHALSLQESFVQTAKSTSPAVVVIVTGRNYILARNRYNYIPGKSPLFQKPENQGSGFFVSEDGYIVTNNHIVRGQDFFTVKLHDGRSFKAKLTGADPASDLAILKIEQDEKFPFLKFASGKNVRVGHWAIAIGAPFNLEHTVTAGIVSHKKRAVGLNLYENYIQTDASINPGNSGGPLLNLKGEVIGVNDFILSPAGGNIGLSFAIDGDMAKKICRQLIKRGKVSRPWLGIALANLPDSLKKKNRVNKGALITGVHKNSPAALYSLRGGDIILEVNGEKISSPAEVQQEIHKVDPGAAVSLKLQREGGIMHKEIPTTEAPELVSRQR